MKYGALCSPTKHQSNSASKHTWHDSQGNKEMHMTRAAADSIWQYTKEVGVPSSAHSSQLKTVMCALCNTLFVGILIIWGRQSKWGGRRYYYAQTAVTLLRATHHMVYTARRETKLRPALCRRAAKIPSAHRNSFCIECNIHNKHATAAVPFTLCRSGLWFSICCQKTISWSLSA